jgi:hypothetical protein
VVDLLPHHDPDLPRHLSGLADSLQTRFDRTNEVSDLDLAISSIQQALALTVAGHPDREYWQQIAEGLKQKRSKECIVCRADILPNLFVSHLKDTDSNLNLTCLLAWLPSNASLQS